MAFVRIHSAVIRHELDAAAWDLLSDEEADAGEEDGALGGNGQYLDLRACTEDDLRYALVYENDLISRIGGALDPASAERAFDAARPQDDEQSALWGLDLGVASAVLALTTLGAHTVASCNAGAFGSPHHAELPHVAFYLADACSQTLLRLARAVGVGLIQEDGKGVLYARSILDLLEFAQAVLNDPDGAA